MSVSKAVAYQHALCLDLKEGHFQSALVSKSTKKIADKFSTESFDFNRESLDKILADDFFKGDYADFVLTVGGLRNTLVPTGIFNSSKPEEIFKLNYSEPHDDLDFNRIPELDIVNIYELPLWIKRTFVIKFPRVKIYHRSSVLLKGIFSQPVFYPKVHLYIDKESFNMFITDKKKLTFFNRFDYRNIADVVYHTLFVMDQKSMSQENTEINLYGVSPKWEHLNEFRSFFKKEISVFEEPEKGEDFILAKQLLCV